MSRHRRLALVAGTALILGTGAAMAQIAPPPPAPDMYGPGPMRGRLAERALRDFDLNHDGKIARAEVDKVLAQRFAAASGGAPAMSEAQFVKSHEAFLRAHSSAAFKRVDWNGDGVLSLDEFRAPLRARFAKMDRDGSGVIACAPKFRPGMRGRHRGLGGGLAKMCHEADLNKDGRLTRAEFDKAVADRYAAAVKGGHGLTADAFYALERGRFVEMEARRFKRLDKNHDGKLSEAEFAAPGLKLFARLDRNKDGVVSKDELVSPRHGPHRGARDKRPG